MALSRLTITTSNVEKFPFSSAFTLTINKSQVQTLNRVGAYLPEPVFTHGQLLYVAWSRTGNPDGLK
jgi:ATP-dependent DNA helicase PIF1